MPEEQVKEVIPQQPELVKLLEGLPGAPDKATVEAWKAGYGEVFVSGFSPTELYVFRPLSRKEHRTMQMTLAQANGEIDNFRYEEMVCEACVLFPLNVDWNKTKGGTASSLFEQILQNSNFLNPQQASMLVVKL
jgi:hypothetical protein